MSEFTNQDLRKAREAQKMPRWKLAAAVNVSESTLERWESGETMPHPDEVDRIADALGEPMIWHRWMLSTYDSYRRRYISSDDYSLPVMAMKLRHEMDDVRALQDALERDAIDGRMDDEPLLNRTITELQQMKREGAEYTFRILYEQFTSQFTKLTEALAQMSPENQAKYAGALRKAMNKMLELLPGEQEA